MKITKEHLAYMKSRIDAVLLQDSSFVQRYERGIFPFSHTVKDLQKRFCFDLLYKANLEVFLMTKVYPYASSLSCRRHDCANDDHIYTALKSICPTVTKRY